MATVKIPIDLRTPRLSTLAGNAFWTVKALTNIDQGVWEFVKDVDGKIYGVAPIPASIATVPNPMIVLIIGANATSGITRLNIATKFIAQDAESYDVTLTNHTAQDITVPGTARLTKQTVFSTSGDFANIAANDILVVELFHEGSHANDTLAVNTELLDAYLLVDIP
jgi:hypothetical protein